MKTPKLRPATRSSYTPSGWEPTAEGFLRWCSEIGASRSSEPSKDYGYTKMKTTTNNKNTRP